MTASLGERDPPISRDGTSGETVSRLLEGASLEATLPSQAEIDTVAGLLGAGAEIFVSDVPRRSNDDAVAASAWITAAGLRPVPHIAVRRIASAGALRRLVSACAERGGARTVLLIAGDGDTVAGPFADTLAVLREGLLADTAIEEIAVAGYPDGHAVIAGPVLDDALALKRELLEGSGLRWRIVTQFGFDAAAIVRWLDKVRQTGIDVPIHVGIAGPASVATLVKFAMRCGVRTSGRGLTRNGGRIGRAIVEQDPGRLVASLAQLVGDRSHGPVRPHFYSFGGAVRTAAWIDAVRRGRAATGFGE